MPDGSPNGLQQAVKGWRGPRRESVAAEPREVGTGAVGGGGLDTQSAVIRVSMRNGPVPSRASLYASTNSSRVSLLIAGTP